MKEPNSRRAACHERKEALLPQVLDLARQGLSCREIAEKVGVAKTTVSDWLQAQRAGPTAKSLGTPRGAARLVARYESLYCKALKEWGRSRGEKQVRTVVKIDDGDGSVKTKEIVRTETRTANPAYLAKAIDALKGLADLHRHEAARRGEPAEFADESISPESFTLEDLEKMTDEELYALDARAVAAMGPQDGPIVPPVVTEGELRAMMREQLDALDAQCLAVIERAGNPQPSPAGGNVGQVSNLSEEKPSGNLSDAVGKLRSPGAGPAATVAAPSFNPEPAATVDGAVPSSNPDEASGSRVTATAHGRVHVEPAPPRLPAASASPEAAATEPKGAGREGVPRSRRRAETPKEAYDRVYRQAIIDPDRLWGRIP